MVNLPLWSVGPLPPSREFGSAERKLTTTKGAGTPSMVTVPVAAYRDGSESHPQSATGKSKASAVLEMLIIGRNLILILMLINFYFHYELRARDCTLVLSKHGVVFIKLL